METITVLVVDNDRADNRALQDDLSDVGFNVLTTNTELDGLEELQYGTNIDVVLLDYNLHRRLNDSHTLRNLNTQFPKAKAIGMTRYDNLHEARQSLPQRCGKTAPHPHPSLRPRRRHPLRPRPTRRHKNRRPQSLLDG